MSNHDDFFIQVLAYGANDLSMGGDGLTYGDIKSGMQAFGYSIETLEEHERVWKIIRKAFVYPEGLGGCRKYYLSLESYFVFLDYMENNDSEHHQKHAS